MWSEKTKHLVADGQLAVIGVVQEQHAERARLYQQWKQYSFPIAQDAFTGLGLAVVPVPILLDEHGYVMKTRLKPNDIAALVAEPADAPSSPAPRLDPLQLTVDGLKANAPENPTINFSIAMGDALLKSNSPESTRKAIQWYESAVEALGTPDQQRLMGMLQFRIGVAFRTLFDQCSGDAKDPVDFTRASAAWSRALDQNPNQYIWRRRIQQYGPRQIKPYPFYDWVQQAQTEIADRGETPVQLTVPLSGAEVAQPGRQFETTAVNEANPDPDSQIVKDREGLVQFHATVVPTKVAPGDSVRVHLRFEPRVGKWNNETDQMQVWINDSNSGTVSASRLVHPNAKEPSSTETRTFEFEFQTDKNAGQQIELTGYALYFVCKTDDGQCLFLRHDFTVPVEVSSKH